MSEAVDVKMVSSELFVPVVLVRDIRRATIEDGKAVKLASPMGFSEQSEKEAVRVRFRRLDGKKIKLAGWSQRQPSYIMTPLRELWFACYVPGNYKVSVPRADGKVAMANMKGNKHGDYLVCPATPSSKPDKSRVYVVSNMWFHKMFGFTKDAEERAKKLRAGIKLTPIRQGEQSEIADFRATATHVEPKQKAAQGEGLAEPTGEVPVDNHEVPVGRPKIAYPKVGKRRVYIGSIKDNCIAIHDWSTQDIIYRAPIGPGVLKASEDYDLEKAEVTHKIEHEGRRWFVIRLNKHSDSEGRYVLCAANGLLRLTQSGVIKDVAVVERGGRNFLRGYNGLKLDELPGMRDESETVDVINNLPLVL